MYATLALVLTLPLTTSASDRICCSRYPSTSTLSDDPCAPERFAVDNSTDADAYAIDGNSGPAAASGTALAGAGYRHPVSGKPLVVLYVEPSFEPRYTAWLKANPASIGNRFHIGFSDGNNWRAGLYGWM